MKYLYTSFDQLYPLLENHVKTGIKHKHYDHVVKVADFWEKMVTGKNQDEYIVTYRPTETEQQKKQRIRVYKTRTKYLINRVRTQIKKSNRVDYAVDQIFYNNSEEDNEKKVSDLKVRLENFHADQSVKDYLNDQFLEYNERDPNALLLVNFNEVNSSEQKPSTYPIIIPSSQVNDYKRENGILQYAICNLPATVRVSDNEVIKSVSTPSYTVFAPQLAITLELIQENQIIEQGETRQIIQIEHEDKPRSYFIETFEHGSERLQIDFLGYVKDPCTKGETFESIYFPGKEILEDVINKKSEVDTNLLVHGILQKFAYKPACRNFDKATNQKCDRGKINGKKCKVCDGSGFQPYHTSNQDIITLNLQLNEHTQVDQIIDLQKLIHYAEIPKHIIDMHRELVKELEKDFSNALFNVDVFSQEFNGTKTAEEIRARNEALNNVLFEYCVAKSYKYKFVVEQTASFMDQLEGLVCNFKPATDFKLDTLADLLEMYSRSEGAPKNVRESILDKIYQKQNQDNPERVQVINARERWRPFRHMTESERSITIDILPADHPEKILWLHFDRIFSEIENTKRYQIQIGERSVKVSVPFHKIKAYDIQEMIVDTFVEKYREKFSQFTINQLVDPTQALSQDFVVPEEEAEEEIRTGGSPEGNTLARSVGGSAIIGQLNDRVASGKLSREGGINAAMIQLGYDRNSATLLIPEPPKSTPNKDLV